MSLFSIPTVEEKKKRDKKLIEQSKVRENRNINTIPFVEALTQFSQETLDKYKAINDIFELDAILKENKQDPIVLQTLSLIDNDRATFFGLLLSTNKYNLVISKDLLKTQEAIDKLTKLTKLKLIGYKVSNEINILRRELNIECEYYWDVYIAAKVLNENETSYDILDLCNKYLPKIDILKFSKFININKNICIKKTKQYCSTYSELILQLYDFQFQHLTNDRADMKQLYELFTTIEMPCTKVIADLSYRGIDIDKKLFDKLYKKYKEECNIAKNTNDKRFATYTKLLDMVFKPISESIKANKVYSSFDQYASVTGRISSSKPNLQTIPSKNEFNEIRQIITAKNDYILISSDFSSQEPRLTAHLCQDKNLLKIFNDNLDLYSKIASIVLNLNYENCLEYDKDGNVNNEGIKNRTIGKKLWLSIMYGMDDNGLAKELKMNVNDVKKLRTSLFTSFPKLKEFIDNTILSSKKLNYVQSIWGRKRRFPELKNKNLSKEALAKIQRQSVNATIQGSGSDMLKKVMIDINNDKILHNLGYELLLPIHDELIGQCPEQNITECTKRLTYLMSNCVKDKVAVPIKSDIKCFKCWNGEIIHT